MFRTPQFLWNPLPALSFWRILTSNLTARDRCRRPESGLAASR